MSEINQPLPLSANVSARLAMLVLLAIFTFPAAAQDSSTDDAASALASRQASVAARYARLEELLLRLADMEARENPERSALLRRVAKQSRERFVLEKLRGAGESIGEGQLSKALTDQKSATAELESILKLLMSEDRSTRIRDEKKRISELIKQLRLTERNERSVRARTENGVEISEVEKEQKKIAERAEELRQELADEDESESEQEADEETSNDKESENESESKDGKQAEAGEQKDSEQESGEKSDGEKQDGEQKDSEKKDGEKKDSEQQEGSQKSGEQKPSEIKEGSEQAPEPQEPKPQEPGQAQDSPPDEGESPPEQPPQQPPKPQSPQQQAEQQLQKAIEKMKQAEQKLAQNERQEATQQQREAEEELRQAIDRLEKILRQLREEEMERELAKLEARLRKMAAMQSAVLDETIELSKTPTVQRNRATDLKAGDLAFEQQKITLEADRAMLLLREEGTSVAFPEVVAQLRDDTVRVATRLGQSKIDAVTQGIQDDVLAALEEMIAALAKAQRDLEKKKQQEQQGGGGGQPPGSGEEPLVQSLAELKLIRTMQTRIQGTTDRYAGLMGGDNENGEDAAEEQQATADEVLPLLRDLSQRQDRLYKITRDLVTERNKK